MTEWSARLIAGSRTLCTQVKTSLDALDARLSRLGRYGSAAALTLLATLAFLILHIGIASLAGTRVSLGALLRVSLEVGCVAAPIVVYAREVISQLKRSRETLDAMSRKLAVAAQQAESANRAKSTFIANMSHELRTPLNAIMGFSEVMKDQHLGPLNNARYVGYAADIHASGRYLLGIINDILDLSKIEAGKMSIENAEEFALRDAVCGSLSLVAALSEKYDVKVLSQLPPENVRLVAVERMIRQIMINLVGNAIKFTPAGGWVEVGGGPTSDGGYSLTIKDSGIGMSKDEIVKAMIPFGQVENKFTTSRSGTGLGLPLAKAMLELHGGTLAIESMPGHGTLIALKLPAQRVSGLRKAPQAA